MKAREDLFATKPWPFHFLRQSRAVKELAASNDPESIDVLIEAVDRKHRLARGIRAALAAVREPARIDRACCIWAEKRQPWLGEVIKANQWTGETDGVVTLCALKAGLQARLGDDPGTRTVVLALLSDPDAEVRAGGVAYAARLPNEPAANDALFDSWASTQSDAIEMIIAEQKRAASAPARNVSFMLARGDLPAYAALNDASGQLFREAYTLATPPQRQRIDRAVQASGDRWLQWLRDEVSTHAWKGATDHSTLRCHLKASLQARLGNDPGTRTAVLALFSDPDAEVKAGVVAYAARLPNEPAANDALFDSWASTQSEAIEKIIAEQKRASSAPARNVSFMLARGDLPAYAALNDAAGQLFREAYTLATPPQRQRIDRAVKASGDRWLQWLRDEVSAHPWTGSADDTTLRCHLKAGLQDRLGQEPRTVAVVLPLLSDADAEVKAGVAHYAGRLPRNAAANDAIFDAWIRTQSSELATVIREQKRLPSSVAKETLFHLAAGDVAAYLELPDENGQIFREAWGVAPDALRQRVTQIVTKSGDRRLIDAYTRALGVQDGADAKTAIEARKTAGDEDGLFDSCRPLGVLELLDVCARWAESGRLPRDPGRRRFAELAIAGWREVGKIEFEKPAPLPEGLVDFFEFWEQPQKGEAENAQDPVSEDPFARAGSAWAAHRRGGLPPEQVKKLAGSADWPERLVARLIDPQHAAAPNEHVEWTSLAGGVIGSSLFAATAGGTPAEHEMLLRLRDANAGRTDRTAAVNRGLANVLLAFQSFFQRGVITSQADDGAQERDALQDGGAADAKDMQF